MIQAISAERRARQVREDFPRELEVVAWVKSCASLR
jgi:hypothetical protein